MEQLKNESETELQNQSEIEMQNQSEAEMRDEKYMKEIGRASCRERV